MSSEDIANAARAVLAACEKRSVMIALAESCTGGLIAAAITDIPGSARALERGWITYSNTAKVEELGVPGDMLEEHGAVSEQVAIAMAEGAIKRSTADASVAVTGIAGPGGGSEEKPIGLVHISVAGMDRKSRAARHIFPGDRADIRAATVKCALEMLEKRILG